MVQKQRVIATEFQVRKRSESPLRSRGPGTTIKIYLESTITSCGGSQLIYLQWIDHFPELFDTLASELIC